MRASWILLTSLILLSACSDTFRSTNNLAYLYKKEKTSLHPNFKIYHKNDSISELHFSMHSEELLYVRNPSNNTFTARVGLSYKLFTSYQSNELVDSATVVLRDENPKQVEKYIQGKLDIKIPRGKFILKLSTTDLNKNRLEHNFLEVDKIDQMSDQNFLVRDAETKRVLYTAFVSIGQKLVIEYNKKSIDQLQGSYYDRIFQMPPPPFASYNQQSFDYTSDSSFVYTIGETFEVPRSGFYHFSPSTQRKAGLSLFQFTELFPYLKTIEDLLYPMRFIMSRKDFEFLYKAGNQRASVETFWTEASGNRTKARSLIEQYYSRVENANYHFSSHLEGWKTDRGMIYLIFGQPNIIYRTGGSETWIYGVKSNQLSLNFVFVKLINPFTDNHFVLNRSPIYKNPWYRAVDEWRAGRAYNL